MEIIWIGKEKVRGLESPLKTVAVKKGSTIDRVIVALHGFGDTAMNFASLAQEIPLDNTLWLFPEGPRHVPMNMGGAQWFSLFDDPNKEIRDSENLICQLCASASQALEIPMSRFFMMGFSQGAAMALNCALKSEHLFAGILVLSGFVIQQPEMLKAATEEKAKTPVFLAHGQQDQVLFPAFFYEAKQIFKHMGFSRVTAKIYSMGHQICGEEIFGIKKFIEENRR